MQIRDKIVSTRTNVMVLRSCMVGAN